MSASVEKISDLERRVTVAIAAEKIESAVDKELNRIAKTAKVDGFRQGKVPKKELERRYGAAVRQDVLNDLMQRSFFEAVNEKELRPAGMPHIEPKVASEDGAFEFTATFEVYPEVTIPDFKKMAIERETSSVADKDIDETLEAIRKQQTTWKAVSRAAKDGDRVTMDFAGKIDGEPLDKGEAKDFELVLGSKSMIPGFEEGIVGAKAGDKITIHPTFPKDYYAEHLAGKPVEFAITVHEVAEPQLPELTDEFAKTLGIKEGGMAKLREEIRRNMERELDFRIKSRVKKEVMDALFNAADVKLPKALVDSEIQQLQQQLMQQLGGKGDIQAFAEKSGDLFEEQAKRRVTLGLIVGEIIKQHELKPDAAQVKAHLEAIAAAYEQPSDVVKWYMQDKNRLAEIEAVILEQQVVDKILADAKVTDKTVAFAEMMRDPNQAHAGHHHHSDHDHDHSQCDHDH